MHWDLTEISALATQIQRTHGSVGVKRFVPAPTRGHGPNLKMDFLDTEKLDLRVQDTFERCFVFDDERRAPYFQKLFLLEFAK